MKRHTGPTFRESNTLICTGCGASYRMDGLRRVDPEAGMIAEEEFAETHAVCGQEVLQRLAVMAGK